MFKRLMVFVLTTVMVLAMSALTASAGEITGTGERPMVVEATPDGHHVLHGKSACAFSGLNDEFIEGDTTAPRTQSWGQIPKEVRYSLTSVGFNPGNACNPTRSAGEPE